MRATHNATTWRADRTAEELGIAVQTLAAWRCKGHGPKFIRVGRTIRYRPQDVADWLADHIQTPGEK